MLNLLRGSIKMSEITDLLSEKRLAKYKGISKEDALVICIIANWQSLFILHYHILKLFCEIKLIRCFPNIWAMIGFSKKSISSAEIRII